MKISSGNEYDRLVSCVVGDATGAQFPKCDEIFNYNQQVTTWTETPLPKGLFPKHIIDEANEDLSILAQTLKDFGVKVYRPKDLDHEHLLTTYHWTTDGMYNYCPRDVLLVVDDLVIEAPMTYRARQMEANAYWKIKQDALADDVRWIAAPRPRLLTHESYVEDNNVVLSDKEPIFDAANKCCCNRMRFNYWLKKPAYFCNNNP